MHLNKDTAIVRELTELTEAELNIVTGGVIALANNLGIATSGNVTGINFSPDLIRVSGPSGTASAGSPTTQVGLAS